MNSNIVEKYVKFKILEIKYLYKKIIKVIFNYEKNLNIMEKNMLLSTKKKNIIIHSIYIYHKKLNSKYNNYLNNLTKIDVIPNFYLEILNILEESNFNFLDNLNNYPELVLLGVGKIIEEPFFEIRSKMSKLSIPIEIMTTPAACRTWNVLLSEGRNSLTCIKHEY